MGEVHVSPWANFSSLESPNAKIIYSNQAVSNGSGARYMTATMSPQLLYKNLNARGWSTTNGKTLVTFDRPLFDKEQQEEEEVSPGTESRGVSSSEMLYGPTSTSAAYIVKNYDPLNTPFQSPSMTLGRKAPKTKDSNYAKLLTAQPNRRQMPLVNMRCASSLDDQIDTPSRGIRPNNDCKYLAQA
ncbi:hypothetical protein Ciccas_000080 [Cichlidogyrus casuarinus]|uniref:Uncharacterized protein n=1 Tax=Cichlidogyrus casuarinus TaxID=1844966 RepID=A0ABD2QS10_9PLAT